MEGRRKVRIKILSHRPVTNRDLKQEKSFFRWSLSKFLQLVVVLSSEWLLDCKGQNYFNTE